MIINKILGLTLLFKLKLLSLFSRFDNGGSNGGGGEKTYVGGCMVETKKDSNFTLDSCQNNNPFYQND